MSQYLPTIDITPQVYDLLKSGSLYLQPGQWVRFCTLSDDPPSRWVGAKKTGILWATHGANTDAQFKHLIRARRADINRFHNRTTP